MSAIFSNQAGEKTTSSVLQKHGRSGSQGPSCESVADSSVALVALEAIRPVDILVMAPDMVEQPGPAVLADIAGPTEIVEDPDSEPVVAMNSQAVAVSEHRTVPRRRMANRPARPGHHQNMPPLPDLPAD